MEQLFTAKKFQDKIIIAKKEEFLDLKPHTLYYIAKGGVKVLSFDDSGIPFEEFFNKNQFFILLSNEQEVVSVEAESIVLPFDKLFFSYFLITTIAKVKTKKAIRDLFDILWNAVFETILYYTKALYEVHSTISSLRKALKVVQDESLEQQKRINSLVEQLEKSQKPTELPPADEVDRVFAEDWVQEALSPSTRRKRTKKGVGALGYISIPPYANSTKDKDIPDEEVEWLSEDDLFLGSPKDD